MISARHYAKPDIQRALKELQDTKSALWNSWQQRADILKQCYDLQVYLIGSYCIVHVFVNTIDRIMYSKYSSCSLLCFFLSQVFVKYAKQAEAWIASKEAFLANTDVGVSPF